MNKVSQVNQTYTERNLSRYEKIALDIAYSIYNGEFNEGELIKGRSTLSVRYSVSSETIRRSIKLLNDMKVLESIDKVGVKILSQKNAHLFIQEFQSKNQILLLREQINSLAKERESINQEILHRVDSIIEQSIALRNIGIVYPLEHKIEHSCHIIGQTIGQIRFWEHTGATIIGINRDGKLYLSPGPNHIFELNDTILYVGNVENISDIVTKFIKGA